MANLYLAFFGTIKDGVPAQPISTQAMTTSTTSAESANFPAGAKVVRMFSTIEHYVTEGVSSDALTATAGNGFYLPANTLYDVGINHIVGAPRQFAAVSFT